MTRLDYQPSTSDTITGRFSFMQDDSSRMYILDPLNSPDDATLQYGRDYTLIAGWSHIFNPQVLNQLRGQVVPSDTADVPMVSPNTAYLTLGTLAISRVSTMSPTMLASGVSSLKIACLGRRATTV